MRCPRTAAPCPSCTLRLAGGRRAAADAPGDWSPAATCCSASSGRGGAKDVWLAHDLTLDRAVALARVTGPCAWERLRREARLTARLGGHRHIVTVHDVFDDDGTPCLVARYMTGGSLADRLARARRPGGSRPQEVIARRARDRRRARARPRARRSSTATSSPTTSGSTPTARPRSATSASRSPRARPAAPRRHAALRRAGAGAAARPSRRAATCSRSASRCYELLCGVRPFEPRTVPERARATAVGALLAGVPEGSTG